MCVPRCVTGIDSYNKRPPTRHQCPDCARVSIQIVAVASFIIPCCDAAMLSAVCLRIIRYIARPGSWFLTLAQTARLAFRRLHQTLENNKSQLAINKLKISTEYLSYLNEYNQAETRPFTYCMHCISKWSHQ